MIVDGCLVGLLVVVLLEVWVTGVGVLPLVTGTVTAGRLEVVNIEELVELLLPPGNAELEADVLLGPGGTEESTTL